MDFATDIANVNITSSATESSPFYMNATALSPTPVTKTCATFTACFPLQQSFTDLELAEATDDESHCNQDAPAVSTPLSCTVDMSMDLDSVPITELLLGLSCIEQDLTFAAHGYQIQRKMMDSLQGELFDCTIVDSKKRQTVGVSRVVIKQVSKNLHRRRESKADPEQKEDTVLVEEDLVKEALILKHLTKDNRTTGGYIARFIEFFENDEDFFLVMEYAGDITLAEWVQRAFQLMLKGQLRLSEYKKSVKFLFWQICVSVNSMHDMDVCHLDLCLENIVVNNGDFEWNEAEGVYQIDANITAKIIDFGLAEKFHSAATSHTMGKWGLKNSYCYTEPKMFAELEFDGFKADIWSLGQILFAISCGRPLCVLPDEEDDIGFRVLTKGRSAIIRFLEMNHLKKYFSNKSLWLIQNTLKIDEKQRFSAHDVLKCEWFACYYQRYGARIAKKSQLQRARNLKQEGKMPDFPYYVHWV